MFAVVAVSVKVSSNAASSIQLQNPGRNLPLVTELEAVGGVFRAYGIRKVKTQLPHLMLP